MTEHQKWGGGMGRIVCTCGAVVSAEEWREHAGITTKVVAGADESAGGGLV